MNCDHRATGNKSSSKYLLFLFFDCSCWYLAVTGEQKLKYRRYIILYEVRVFVFKKSMYLDSTAVVMCLINAILTSLHSRYRRVSFLWVSRRFTASIVSVLGGITKDPGKFGPIECYSSVLFIGNNQSQVPVHHTT